MYSPHTRQDRDSLKKGRTLNSPPYVSGSFGSHCRRERHADTYSAVAFTGFISATSVNSRTRGAGWSATERDRWSDSQRRITVRTQLTRLDPTPQTKSVIWHDSQADERLWVVCLLTCQCSEDFPETVSSMKSCCKRCIADYSLSSMSVGSRLTLLQHEERCTFVIKHTEMKDWAINSILGRSTTGPRRIVGGTSSAYNPSTNNKWKNRRGKQFRWTKSIILEIFTTTGVIYSSTEQTTQFARLLVR